jgi:hypothetical protein
MGGLMSKSNNCEEYKAQIKELNQELNDYKSGRMSLPNAGDPYNDYSGGKKRRNKRTKKCRKSRKSRKL